MTTVFISGATGYIATHIVKQLLDKGYTVIGSVRSEDKGQDLKKVFNTSNFSYEIVADIGKEGAFDEALRKHPDITVFLHTASPVTMTVEDPERDLLIPAVRGTENALKAIAKYGRQITKVVFTSSFAAVATPAKESDSGVVYSEESWNEITWDEATTNGSLGYRGSKKYAERAVWQFIKDNDVNFTLNVVNPTFVFGPQVSDSAVKENMNFSVEIVNSFLKLTPDSEIPGSKGRFIDVRDVARAHVLAFEDDSIQNQRLLLQNGTWDGKILLNILNSQFPQLKGKLPVGEPSVISPQPQVDNSKTKRILGFEFISLEQSVVDTVEQILSVKS